MYWMNSTACSPKIIIPNLYNRHHHLIAQTAQCKKNRRRAVSYVSTGLACLPRDANTRATTAEERLYKRHPIGLPRDALRHTQRAEPPFPGSPALRLNQLLFSYSITFCALPSTTTTYTPLSRRTSPMPRNANCPATV